MADRSYKLTLSLSDGSTINAGTITAPQGPNGANGANGATFTPSVSAAGVLSWTNNGGLTNPPPISIKGPKGDDAVITASDVENWGFTKNKGTVTSVAVKLNGAIKGTVTSSGTIDLGTVLTEHQDISGKANLLGGNTFTGKQTLNSPGSDGYSINASGYIKGSWLQASAIANKGVNTGKVCVFDNSGWIYYRTPAEILAEAGGAKAGDIPTNYVNTDTAQDIDGIKSFYKTSIFKNGMQLGDGNKLYGASDVSNIENYMPQKDGTLAVLGDIPEIVQVTGTSTKSVMSQNSITNELAKKAKIVGGNTFENTQYFSGYSADANYDYSIIDCFFGDGDNSATIFGVKHNADANDSGRVLIGADDGTNNSVEIQLNGNAGTVGQVLTSQGAGKTPVWKDIQIPDKAQLSVPNAKIPMSGKWTSKTWGDYSSFGASIDIWTDGDYIYASNGKTHYKLDKATSTWHRISWKGLTSFFGHYIWTDGNNIYYSNVNEQYVLNKSTSTWSTKTWNGLTNFLGEYVWTDGNNIYYSNGNEQYVLNKSTSTWSTKTWNGLTKFKSFNVWTDGNNIYYSNVKEQYILNKTTSTWVVKSWKGYNNIQGEFVWTDGDNIYHSTGSSHYVLDIALSTWNSKTWNGTNSNKVYGSLIWTDGDNIYCSNGSSTQLQLVKSTVANKTSINSDIKNIYKPITKIIGSNGTYVADSSGSVTLPSDSVASVVDLSGSLIGGDAYFPFNNGEEGSFTGIIECEYNTSAGDFQFEINNKIFSCTPTSQDIILHVTIDRLHTSRAFFYYYTIVSNDASINTSGFFTDTNSDMHISTNMGSSYYQLGVGTIIKKVL